LHDSFFPGEPVEQFGIHSSWVATRAGAAGVPGRTDARQRDLLTGEITTQYDLLREPVFRYLVTIGVGAGEAEDILQEAFLRAYQHLARRPGLSHNVRAWIFRVAHNLAINGMKRKAKLSYGLELSHLDSLARGNFAPSAEETLLEQEAVEQTRAAMAKLTPHEQQCLQLRAEGLRYREIAEIVGTGISAVAEAVARGCRKLTD
jgi:RNA polymerase sigma-70 factor (ECF subfamily)